MPWLAELVHSSEGSLDVLPVQCLCEFLLMEKTGDSDKDDDDLQDKRVVCNFLTSHLDTVNWKNVVLSFCKRRNSPIFVNQEGH